MNIILLGYRGSGKTSVGRELAQRLGLDYVDVDDKTRERFNNATIAQIWTEHGEPAWRAAEVQATQQLLEQDNQVIGLGGGTLMQPAARQAVEQATDCLRIYLKCTADELYRRISGDTQTAATRPNLTGLGGGIEEVQHMLDQREPTYQAVADRVLNVAGLSIEQAADEVVRWVDTAS